MIRLDVVTPQGKVVENVAVESVVLPAALGEVEILSGHSDLLTLLQPGILRFQLQGQERKFAISYGFVEVRKDHVTVLAETCEESHQIDAERARAARIRAEQALLGNLEAGDFEKHQLKLQRARVRESLAP